MFGFVILLFCWGESLEALCCSILSGDCPRGGISFDDRFGSGVGWIDKDHGFMECL